MVLPKVDFLFVVFFAGTLILLVFLNSVTGMAEEDSSAASPTITLHLFASQTFERTGSNRVAFKPDSSGFVAPMGSGRIGVFNIISKTEPLDDKGIKRYGELVALLDHDDFMQRQAASKALGEMGFPIRPYLQETFQKTESLEAQTRIKKLLALVAQPIQTVPFKKVLGSTIRSLRYSPNGKHLLVAGYDESIKLLDASDLSVVKSIETKSSVSDALFLQKGEVVAVDHKGSVQFWSCQTGEQLPDSLEHGGGIYCMDASKDEQWMAVSGVEKKVSIWDLKTHKRAHLLENFGDSVGHVEFSVDGKFLACACEDGTVCVYSVPTFRRLHTLKGHKGQVWAVAFAQNSAWLASASNGGEVIIWDPKTGKRLSSITDNKYGCTPMFSPDNQFLLTLEYGRIRMWRIGNANEIPKEPSPKF